MKFWQALVAYVLMMIIAVGLFCFAATKTINKIRKIGLKNMISDVWEGEKADK